MKKKKFLSGIRVNYFALIQAGNGNKNGTGNEYLEACKCSSLSKVKSSGRSEVTALVVR